MRFGLTSRILAICTSLFLVLWILLISFFYRTSDLSETAANPSPRQLAAIADLVSSVEPGERIAALDAIRSVVLDLRVSSRATVPTSEADQEILTAYREVLGDRLLAVRPVTTTAIVREARFSAGGIRLLEFWIAVNDEEALVIEARSPFAVTAFGLPVGLGAGLIGTLFACIAFLLLHREVKPLSTLASAVDRIDPSGEPVPLPVIRTTTPEISALIRAFERLQKRLNVMTRSRMALIGGIQHDVRSFATRLRLRLDRLPDEAERERATADITDMIELLDNALLTSRAGVGVLNEELLDLVELLRTEIADFRSVDLPVSVEVCITEAWVLGDRVALRRIVGNVVDNAVKYGRRAYVMLRTDEDYVIISIEDEGPGFSHEEMNLLLEPFVRAEPSRARSTGGAGLGLAVTQTLVEAHGGKIKLANGRHGGLVVVNLPLFKDG